MEDSSQFRVVAPHKGRRRTVLVKRDQAGTFPFRLERETKSADSGTETRLDDMRMQITLMYRTIEADLFAIMKPHLSAIFEKHDIFGSRRLMEAIISLFAADIHLITHFNSLHTLDSIGRENVKLSTYQEPARLHTYRDSLCSFWTTEDEWDRIRGAIVEAYQVS